MKKILSTTALVIALAIATAACSGSSASTDATADVTIPTPVPTTTTTNNDAEFRAKCVEGLTIVGEGLDTISEGAALLPYVDDATAREFLAIAKEFVQTSKTTVILCSELSPSSAAEVLTALDSLETTIKTVESLY